MDEEKRIAMVKASPSVSAYLLRPLRSHAQAVADIAAARKSAAVVKAIVPLSLVGKKRGARNSDIAA